MYQRNAVVSTTLIRRCSLARNRAAVCLYSMLIDVVELNYHGVRIPREHRRGLPCVRGRISVEHLLSHQNFGNALVHAHIVPHAWNRCTASSCATGGHGKRGTLVRKYFTRSVLATQRRVRGANGLLVASLTHLFKGLPLGSPLFLVDSIDHSRYEPPRYGSCPVCRWPVCGDPCSDAIDDMPRRVPDAGTEHGALDILAVQGYCIYIQ